MKCLLIEEGIIPGFNFHPVTHIGAHYNYTHSNMVHIYKHRQAEDKAIFKFRVHYAQAELGGQ